LAAEASRCAGEQGKYWEYHDLLFADPDQQNRDDLTGHARQLKAFDACLDSGRYRPQIEQDVQMGARNGVFSTPAFFVNGTLVNGAQPGATFEKIIDQELSSAAKVPR
jgi:protein-disulfide isomerase